MLIYQRVCQWLAVWYASPAAPHVTQWRHLRHLRILLSHLLLSSWFSFGPRSGLYFFCFRRANWEVVTFSRKVDFNWMLVLKLLLYYPKKKTLNYYIVEHNDPQSKRWVRTTTWEWVIRNKVTCLKQSRPTVEKKKCMIYTCHQPLYWLAADVSQKWT